MSVSQTFCQVCRHPTPGHQEWCPILTGQASIPGQTNPWEMPCPYCGAYGGAHIWAGAGSCPGVLDDHLDQEIANLKTQIAGFIQEIRLLKAELEVLKAMR